MSTIFKKIIDKEIPADIVYETGEILAFRDINPQAPTHILIVPKKEIPTVDDVEETDTALIGQLVIAAKQIAREQGIAESGYRLIVNCRDDGGQEVYHLHLHLLGGRRLGPMLARRD
jgi:histidine triad (HIT) family protein